MRAQALRPPSWGSCAACARQRTPRTSDRSVRESATTSVNQPGRYWVTRVHPARRLRAAPGLDSHRVKDGRAQGMLRPMAPCRRLRRRRARGRARARLRGGRRSDDARRYREPRRPLRYHNGRGNRTGTATSPAIERTYAASCQACASRSGAGCTSFVRGEYADGCQSFPPGDAGQMSYTATFGFGSFLGCRRAVQNAGRHPSMW